MRRTCYPSSRALGPLLSALCLGAALLAAAPACSTPGSLPLPDGALPADAAGADGAPLPADGGPDGDPGRDALGRRDLGPADTAPRPDLGPPPADQPPGSSTTTIRVHYPSGAASVAIRGSGGPFNWEQGLPMTGGEADTWTFTSETITEPLEWKPLLDDQTWSRGPNYRVEPGTTVDVYPHFVSERGRVTVLIESFQSQHVARDRTVWAYLPPSYDENTRATFPVVYMHDGQNLFDPALAFGGNEWQVDETLDAGAETAGIAEAIVVGIGNTADRIDEYTPTRDDSEGSGGSGDNYLRAIAEELKPTVDSTLRTRPGRETTALVGSSLGGLISSHAGVTRPATFGLIGAMSPSTWWDDRVLLEEVQSSSGAAVQPLRVYIDSGDSGPSSDDLVNTSMLAAAYRGLGYQEGVDLHYVVQQNASHSEYYWAQRLPGALAFLLGGR